MRLHQYSRRALFAAPFFAAVAGRARPADQPISDDVIYDRVNRALITDRDLGGRQLQVTVKDGVVTVTGFVETEKKRKKVESVAKKVKGVREVVNETKVRAF